MAQAIPLAIAGVSAGSQLIGNIGGKNAADQKAKQAQGAFDPMKDLADKLATGQGSYTKNMEGIASGIGTNPYEQQMRDALSGMGNNPYLANMQNTIAQGSQSQYGGNVAELAQRIANVGQGQDAEAMRGALGGLTNNPYAAQLQGMAANLANPADYSNLQNATDYNMRQLEKRLAASSAGRGAVGSSMFGQDLARAGAELYAGQANAMTANEMQRNQMRAGLLSGLGSDQAARLQAQAGGYGQLAQLGMAGQQGAAGLYQGLDAANLARSQFALGGYQGLSADQLARQQGVFSGYGGMNQMDLARQQAQYGAYQGMNEEELRRMLGAGGLYGTVGQAYMSQSQYRPQYDFMSILPLLMGMGGGGAAAPGIAQPSYANYGMPRQPVAPIM